MRGNAMNRFRQLPSLICIVSMTLLAGPWALSEADCTPDHSCCTPSENISCCIEDRSEPIAPASTCQCAGHGLQHLSPTASTNLTSTRNIKKSASHEPDFNFSEYDWKSNNSDRLWSVGSFQSSSPIIAIYRLTLRWRC